MIQPIVNPQKIEQNFNNSSTLDTEIMAICPLSVVQQRLWAIHQFAPTSKAYNRYSALRLKYSLDFNRWKATWQAIIQRHPILRTAYGQDNTGEPVQFVHQVADVPMEVINASTWSQEELQKEILDRADRLHDLSLQSVGGAIAGAHPIVRSQRGKHAEIRRVGRERTVDDVVGQVSGP